MKDNFSSLFQYLKNENINIDQDEFELQAQSHPDYPSLLSIIDTLSFFNIENGALSVDATEIGLLPEQYLAILDATLGRPELYFIEKQANAYYAAKDHNRKILSKDELEKRWSKTVILVEKSDLTDVIPSNKSKLAGILPVLCAGMFALILLQHLAEIKSVLFLIFPILGILFSIAALKDLFGAKSKLLNNFCNITAASSCTAIIDSKKWKIFEFINFSDLSIVFFSSQLFGLLFFLLARNTVSYFTFQKTLLFCAVPILLLSVYYQKNIEKKWCPICLAIIAVIICELAFAMLTQPSYDLQIDSLVIFCFILFSAALGWHKLKKILADLKDMKESQLKSIRFMRNYEIFKNNLLSQERNKLAFSPIILGSRESELEISIITSPFCSYCKEAHEMLEKILLANKDSLKIKILINADIENLDEEKRTFFRILMTLYLDKGEDYFLKAFHDWFENKSIKDWITKYSIPFDVHKIDPIYQQQHQWCIANDSHFTPGLFINEYPYPRFYERESLFFFVKELLDDELFKIKDHAWI
ncbi:MAG: vitamin K epoxide reductase family protein [Flavobacterium nitrogenifigens]|uniref:vitamin K epoxide reductase family protein n=1 Tax=Flavobacterium nitrogenifigens TaxID=1617283 RepID=UPI002806B050|nr:vitamin K epoxide reductase family protein [Flavobacterium nitrogenifigens]MDQ8013221.1 vitamin K epoxide reductase family protein [Flavobacterium nitrogenifigens]